MHGCECLKAKRVRFQFSTNQKDGADVMSSGRVCSRARTSSRSDSVTSMNVIRGSSKH